MTKQPLYLIVPCPEDPISRHGRVYFQNTSQDKTNPKVSLYLGGIDRMKAAVRVSAKYSQVVLVGGSQWKVLAMRKYFKREISNLSHVGRPKLICLVSNPDSTGNLAAFKKYLKRHNENLSNVAIISNAYHLPRLKLVWSALFPRTKPTMLSAEKILDKQIPSKHQEALKRRISCEKKGCRDWQAGRYRDQDKVTPWVASHWISRQVLTGCGCPMP